MNKDEQFMQRAIDLAKIAGVNATPNPLVGAVIVHQDTIIGEGFHQQFGEAHAEVNAISQIENQELLKESTIYITLEPCAHIGKTPPCAELLIQKQFKRVVIGTVDPFAKVAGKGIQLLENASISCTIGILEKECQELNKRFFTFHQQKRPYIILKWAQTQDGFIDAPRNEHETGTIRWISSPETRVFVHQMRAQEQAILVGWKTILNDNPSLTVREVTGKSPLRIVLDKSLKAPQQATVFTDGLPTIVLNQLKNDQQNNVTYIQLTDFSLTQILSKLHEMNILSVIIEGGKTTLQGFIDEGFWDEAHVIVGKSIFNQGIKAPKFSHIPKQSFSFSSDIVYFYKNNTL